MTHNITTILRRLWKCDNYKKIFKTTRIDENVRILDSVEYEEGVLWDRVKCRNGCRVTGVDVGHYIGWLEASR